MSRHIFLAALLLVAAPLQATDYEFTLLHAAGQPSPGVDDASFNYFRPPYLDESGRVFFHASLSGNGALPGVWKVASEATKLLYTENAAISEIGGHYLYDGIPYFGSNANVMFHNDPLYFRQWPDFVLYDGSSFALVPSNQTPKSDPGYRATYASNGDALLVLGHQNPPDPFGSSIDYFVHVADSQNTEIILAPGDPFTDRGGIPFRISSGPAKAPAISKRGDIAFLVYGVEVAAESPRATYAILRRSPGGALHAVTDTTSAGGRITVEAIELADDGRVVFRGKLPFNPPTAIYREHESGGFRAVAKVGDAAPGADGATFSALGRFQITAAGSVVFWATDSAGKDGIWIQFQPKDAHPGTRTLEKVVRDGDTAADGITFESISGGFANGKDQVLFNASRLLPPDNLLRQSLWLSSLDEVKSKFTHSKIVEQYETSLPLPDGRSATASAGGNPFPYAYNLDDPTFDGNTVRGGFNSVGDIALLLPYIDPDTRASVEALWLAREGGIIVNTLSDLPDTNAGDGRADTGEAEIAGRPACSLRAAIQEANARGGNHTIRFDIDPALAVTGDTASVGELQIRPTNPLPTVTANLAIDGLSQPGETTVTLIGTALAGNTPGLDINASTTTISGLQIREFPGHGINNREGQLVLGSSQLSGNNGNGLRTRGPTSISNASIFLNHRWGIECTADALIIESKTDSSTSVSSNAVGGILHYGSTLTIGNVGTTKNGTTLDGHGLFAPNANVVLEDRFEAGENAGHGAFVHAIDAAGGPTLQFHNNRGSGLVVTGSLTVESSLRAFSNHRWGLELSGGASAINTNFDGERTRISGNLAGGILLNTPSLSVYRIDVRDNGLPDTPGGGIDAVTSRVDLDDFDIRDNQGPGIRTGSATLDGGRIRNNTGHGITACPGPLDIEDTSIRGNGASGIHLCGQATGKTSRFERITSARNGSHGIETTNPDQLTVRDSQLFDNSAFGLANLSGATGNIDARMNDWGADDGPSGSGTGTGDEVSGDVDFSSWMPSARPWSIHFNPHRVAYPGEALRIPLVIRGGSEIADTDTVAATITYTKRDGSEVTFQQQVAPGAVLHLETDPDPDASPGDSEPIEFEYRIDDNGLIFSGSLTTTVDIYDPIPTRAEIKPGTIRIRKTEIAKASAFLFDQHDRPLPDSRIPPSGLSWQATGAASIDNEGTVTAGAESGPFTLSLTYDTTTIGSLIGSVNDMGIPTGELDITIDPTLSRVSYKQEPAFGNFTLFISTNMIEWHQVFSWTSNGEPREIIVPTNGSDRLMFRVMGLPF